MKELDFPAVRENLPRVLAFIDAELETLDCGIITEENQTKKQNQKIINGGNNDEKVQ